MKKSILTKIGAAAAVLTLVTASLVGGTFAKYVTNESGTATATAAKWDVKFGREKNADGEISKDFTDTIVLTGSGQNNTILPDDSGEFNIEIVGDQAEVGYKYTIKMEPAGDALPGMTFYKINDDGNVNISEDGISETVYYDETDQTNMNRTIKIGWKLTSQNTTDEEIDAKTIAGKSATYNIVMRAEQDTSTKPTA